MIPSRLVGSTIDLHRSIHWMQAVVFKEWKDVYTQKELDDAFIQVLYLRGMSCLQLCMGLRISAELNLPKHSLVYLHGCLVNNVVFFADFQGGQRNFQVHLRPC